MRHFLLHFTVWVLTLTALGAYAQHESISESKYFKHVGTVTFDKPGTPLIAAINHIDVDSNGRILVTDRIGKQVLLFDAAGTLLASLDVSICHPGIVFGPKEARFMGSESIIVLTTNSGLWGYRFTSVGQCLGRMDRSFSSPRFLDVDPTGALFGAYVWPEMELKQMSSAGRAVREISLQPSDFPNASHRFAGGGLIADGVHLFYASGPDTEILKYDSAGTVLKRIAERNRWFRRPRRDMPADAAQFMAAMKDWRATTVSSLLELTPETLLIQYSNRERGGGYQVFSKDGFLIAEEFGINFFFMYARDSLAYVPIYSIEQDSFQELPQAFLNVYRFSAP